MSITPFPSQGQYPWYDQLKNWGVDTQSAAENATIAADTAQSTADTALTNAATAQTTADTAITNAATAQTRADNAFSNAATAQTTADTAITNAATAQTRADNAFSNAATAQATADAALPVHLPPATGTNLNTLTAVGVHPVPWLTGTLALNFPIASTAGIVEVLPYDGVKLIQRFSPTTGTSATRGTWTRRRTDTSTWGAWVFQPSQRIDNTAGRAIYTWDETQNREQLIYGDTGTRDITSDLTLPAGADHVFSSIRRVGQAVVITIAVSNITGLGALSPIYTIPNGFAPTANMRVYATDTNGVAWRIYGGRVVNLASKTGDAWMSFTYMTDQPWPTTLPGTAVGTIPFN